MPAVVGPAHELVDEPVRAVGLAELADHDRRRVADAAIGLVGPARSDRCSALKL